MSELQWFYPDTVEEAVELISRERTIPYGGGTGILRGNLRNIRGLVDLSRLPLQYQRKRGGTVELGACTTFADAAAYLRGLEGECILSTALGSAASTPLRNRITLGGSTALFPAWSDLMGPLLALDAEVELAGKVSGRYPVERYTNEKDLRKGALITAIRIGLKPWEYHYYQEARTFADHPVFTLTLLCMKEKDRIKDFRAVVTGCTGRYRRLKQVEELLTGSSVDRIETAEVVHAVDVRFTERKFMGREYLNHLLLVEFERGLEDLLGR